MRPPLTGRIIAVTRPPGQAEALTEKIVQAGGQPLLVPLLHIAPPNDSASLDAAIAQLDEAALVVFISPNAVRYSIPLILQKRRWPGKVLVAAVGQGTAKALEDYLSCPVCCPAAPFDSEALLRLPELAAARVSGRTVLLFKGEGGRALLAQTLRERGAQVVEVPCYRRLPPASEAFALVDATREGRLDAVVVTSSESMAHLAALFDAQTPGYRPDILVVAPHPRIADAARDHGFHSVLLTESGDAGVLAGLTAYNWPSIRPSEP